MERQHSQELKYIHCNTLESIKQSYSVPQSNGEAESVQIWLSDPASPTSACGWLEAQMASEDQKLRV